MFWAPAGALSTTKSSELELQGDFKQGPNRLQAMFHKVFIADKMSSSKKRQLSGEVSRSEDDKRACSADRLPVPAPAPASTAACVSNSPPKVSGKQ